MQLLVVVINRNARVDEVLAGFVEPGSVNYLLFRYGRVGNRLVLLNMDDPSRGASRRALAKEVREDAR